MNTNYSSGLARENLRTASSAYWTGMRILLAWVILFSLCGPARAWIYPSYLGMDINSDPVKWTGLIETHNPTLTSNNKNGYGSGAVIYHPKIVMSCAHVVFDDNANVMSNDNYWYLRQNGSQPFSRTGVKLRGYWYFNGYVASAEARINSNAAFAKDFVAHFSYSNLANGGYGGTWLGDAWGVLQDTNRWKMITGYPLAYTQFYMGQTGPWRSGSPFVPTPDPNYLTLQQVTTAGGNSGGPVWVSSGGSNGPYYFSGVLVSGEDVGVPSLGVKTMNEACWTLVNNAIGSARSWHNSAIGTASNVTSGERMAVYNKNWNHIYYRGTDGRIWVCYALGGRWISAGLGNQANVAGSLAFNPNWNHVYYRGNDNYVWVCFVNNGVWVNQRLGTANNVGGELVFNPNWNHVYYRATDGTPWACFVSGGRWFSQPLVGSATGGSWTFNASWNNIIHRNPATGGLGAVYALPTYWVNLPFGSRSNVAPSAVLETNRIGFNPNWNTLFYQGNDNQLWAAYIRNGAWFQGGLGGSIGGPLVVNTTFNVVQYRGQDGSIWAGQANSNGWSHNTLGNNTNVTAPLVFGSQWNHVYYRGTDGNIWALHYD